MYLAVFVSFQFHSRISLSKVIADDYYVNEMCVDRFDFF